jgi:hypothetical protein
LIESLCLVVGVPVAVAAAPMIASYVLFPFVSVASGLMPEFSSEVAGTVSRASVIKDTILFKTYYIVHFINPKSNHPALLG